MAAHLELRLCHFGDRLRQSERLLMHGKADFSMPGTMTYNFWLGVMLLMACSMLILGIMAVAYLRSHKLRAVLFLVIFAGWFWFWISQFESRGGSILSSSTPVYCVIVIGICMAMGTMMAIKNEGGSKGKNS
ncbi:MAG: hypothetical protein ACR2RF_03780 [Geminicoccaceae bacterium]